MCGRMFCHASPPIRGAFADYREVTVQTQLGSSHTTTRYRLILLHQGKPYPLFGVASGRAEDCEHGPSCPYGPSTCDGGKEEGDCCREEGGSRRASFVWLVPEALQVRGQAQDTLWRLHFG